MRSFAATSALVASLLLQDVLAGPAHGLKHQHEAKHENKRNLIVETATDEVVETVWSTVYMTVPASGHTKAGHSTSTTTAAITTTLSVSASSSSVAVAELPVVSSSSSSAAFSSSTSSSVPVVSIETSSSAAVVVAPTTAAAAVQTTFATSAKASSTSSVAVASSTSASTSTGKRGLAYNSADLLSGFSGMTQISWAYNWGSSSSGLSLSNVEYVPLLWGLSSTFTSAWPAAASSAIASGSTHLMSFNEPDLSSQSNIGYADAAAGFLTYMQPFAGKAKLGSPAVTNGGSPMGLTYLKNFISACSKCTIDFVPIHWYDSASNVDYFKNYIAEAYTAGGNRPIWITEFGCSSGTDAEINTFLQTVLPWLDEQSYVARYAYFMAADGVLLSSGSTLSTLGETYATT
ncbi:hypothetical protein BP6252_08008 [Coleophoma cylindrospora]|uniref:Asl1-like glycosyl hydrolase catalytic domain-containing protein n=1 Tax=Coleophoma cylindrospora TaxID=1849047 RepID=A0A3D8RBQ2_9HELO|nr:hypothetical protein BP6252_08008 [Coleophoma cylindrospora]